MKRDGTSVKVITIALPRGLQRAWEALDLPKLDRHSSANRGMILMILTVSSPAVILTPKFHTKAEAEAEAVLATVITIPQADRKFEEEGVDPKIVCRTCL
jgi:hypothetical protein